MTTYAKHSILQCQYCYIHSGADPGFQVRGGGGGGAHLQTIGVFRVKNHDFTPKKSYFSQF